MSEEDTKNNAKITAQEKTVILGHDSIDQASSPQRNGESGPESRPRTTYERVIAISKYCVKFTKRLLYDVVVTFLSYYYSESVLPEHIQGVLEAHRQRRYAMLTAAPITNLPCPISNTLPSTLLSKKKTSEPDSPPSEQIIETFTAYSNRESDDDDDDRNSADTLMVSSNYSIRETLQYKEKVLNFLHFDNEFLIAVSSGNVRRIDEYLRSGVSLNQKDFSGRTPLHLAVLSGQSRLVKFLLQKGMDPNVHDNVKMAPIAHCLFRYPSLKILKLLFDYGAVVPPRTHKTELGLFIQFVMMCKPTFEEIRCMEYLLSKGQKLEDPNAPGGRQPLHIAAMGNRVTLIRILVDLGANLFVLNHRRQTPKEVALAFDCRDAYDCLASLEAKDLSKNRLDLMETSTAPLDHDSTDTRQSDATGATVRFKRSSQDLIITG